MIRVALIDAGVAARHAARVAAARTFRLAGERVVTEDGVAAACAGALAHGAALADVLCGPPEVALLVARVFEHDLAASAAQLAAALDWAAEEGAQVANVSAGLREDRAPLRDAIARALARGVFVVAAAPARGSAVYPAAYEGVIRATGDARCAPGEISWLGSAHADFGAHARAGETRGASAGCARISAKLAALLAAGVAPARAIEALRGAANYVGPERRVRTAEPNPK